MLPLKTSNAGKVGTVTPKIISKRTKITRVKKPKKVSSRFERTKMKLGRVNLFIENEKWSNPVNLPQYPVEDGLAITDHVEQLSEMIKLEGVFFADSKYSIGEKVKILNLYKKQATRLTYVGYRSGRNFAIKNIDTDKDYKVKNGIPFTIDLLQIRVIDKKKKKKKKSLNGKTSGGRKQTSNSKTKKWHTIKKGDTYSELALKYGTSWRTLYAWNKYPILTLPIGKKMRVR